jgi:hypothetical protein
MGMKESGISKGVMKRRSLGASDDEKSRSG